MTTFQRGDRVMLDPDQRTGNYSGTRIGGDGYRYVEATLRQGDVGEITRVNTANSIVRTNGASLWVPNGFLKLADVPGSNPRRRLGTPPEGDHIAPDDPRIEWMWDDISAYAEKSQYCGTFDHILAELHLPPRKRKFTARGDLNGLEITAEIMAKNQREANEILTARLAEALTQVVAE